MAYGIEVYNPFGRYIDKISKYTKLECSRGLNKVGKFALEVPLTDFDDLFFWKTDMIFRFYHIAETRYLVGNTIWYLEDVEIDFDSQKITLRGHDTIGLLARYLVAYTRGTDYAEKTIDFGLSDYASNLMRQFLRENVGNSVFDTTRDLSSYITIPLDDDLGQPAEKEAAWATLESVCNDLCNQSTQDGTPLFYDLIPNTYNTLTFIVRENTLGVDRSTENPVTFSPTLNNLNNVVLKRKASDSVNVAYMGGDGDDAARLIEKVENSPEILKSPYARREKFYDEEKTSSSSVLIQRGQEVLRKDREKYLLTGNILDLPTQRFGQHFNYGDRVLINIRKYIATALISAFAINSDKDGDTLDIQLSGEVIVP